MSEQLSSDNASPLPCVICRVDEATRVSPSNTSRKTTRGPHNWWEIKLQLCVATKFLNVSLYIIVN